MGEAARAGRSNLEQMARRIEALERENAGLQAALAARPGARGLVKRSRLRRALTALCLTLSLFGFAAWIYVVGTAWIYPNTVSYQLTHFAPWPRTDSFGEVGFVVSFVSFWAWNYLREPEP